MHLHRLSFSGAKEGYSISLGTISVKTNFQLADTSMTLAFFNYEALKPDLKDSFFSTSVVVQKPDLALHAVILNFPQDYEC